MENSNLNSDFILINHQAKKAGTHTDLRVRIPGKQSYWSWAIRKGMPPEPGNKVITIQTTIHSKSEAHFVGTIEIGYGKGTLEKIDSGPCEVIKSHSNHFQIVFHGSKIKGTYHLIRFSKMPEKMYIIFKSKDKEEVDTYKQTLHKESVDLTDYY